jgi:hypothetical protein
MERGVVNSAVAPTGIEITVCTPREGLKAHAVLTSLDAYASERKELLDSGVPAHTVYELYPELFQNLFPGIHRYIDRHGVQHLRGVVPAVKLDLIGPAWWIESKSGQDRWSAEHIFTSGDRFMIGMLERRIHDDLGGIYRDDSYAIRDQTIRLLWTSWWTMRNQSLLRRGRGPAADGLARWVLDNILPGLEDEVEL